MVVKKFLSIALLVTLMAITLPASSSMIVPDTRQTNSAAKTEEPRTQQLLQRLQDIRDMNKSALTRLEKKNLRKEVKGIKREMKAVRGGVYLSVGAIIIIILLLILIL
jgi:hypothetical protein